MEFFMLPFQIMAGILVLFVIIVIVIVIACDRLNADLCDLPEELWDYFTWSLPEKRFQKKVVLKHKRGDMSGIAAMTPGHYIDPDDVSCRRITLQDAHNTNLDLLTWTLMEEGRATTWEEKVKELSQSSKARKAILSHWEYDSTCKVPEELLEAILADKVSLYEIADNLGCGSVIRYMADDGNEAANRIMNIVRERREKKNYVK